MKKIILPLLALVLLFNYGCKDKETEGNPSGLIKSITFIDPEEIYKASYEYDSQNRVEKINFYEDNGPNGYNTVTYNSDGTIKIVEEFDSAEFKVGKTVFSYTENQVTMYSYYDWYEESKEVIDYNANKLIEKYKYYEKYSTAWSLEESSIYEWSNNNISKETSYFTVQKKNNPSKRIHKALILKALTGKNPSRFVGTKLTSDICYTKTFQYDTKNNPMWDFNAAAYTRPTGMIMVSKNNAISNEKIYPSFPSEIESETFVYKYNENNFPTSISILSSYSTNKTKSIDYDYRIEIEYY
ncbi:MAG: hypothetical protein EHM93_06980 [Bacteroidales bacterium]|nr:MAG: hypothetical protein EHM93_06980 [Bacteroidales bacterium]